MRNKDWVGNKNSVFKTLGASNHTDKERQEDDFYATDPLASELLLELESLNDTIIDNSYGAGHLMKPFVEKGHKVIGYDIKNRTEGDLPQCVTFHEKDFLTVTDQIDGDFVCNPPYVLAQKFVEHSLRLAKKGRKVCAFLKLQFLEGKSRRALFEEQPPRTVYVSSSRLLCAKNAKFDEMKAGGGSAVAYAWFVWEKGYEGPTEIRWFN